jgi:MerR family transcriptional regulator, copper efflux regulator
MKITEYMMIHEAAEFIGATANTLRNWEKKGKITVYRNPINNYRMYKKEELIDLLKQITSRID